MIKPLFIITIIFTFLSCSNNKTKVDKSVIENTTNLKKDTLFLGFIYGMNKEKYLSVLSDYAKKGVLDNTFSYITGTCEPITIKPRFTNNKLTEIELKAYNINKNCFYHLYKEKYNLIELSTWKWNKVINIKNVILEDASKKLDIRYFDEKALVPEKELTYKSLINHNNMIDRIVGEVIVNNNITISIQHKKYADYIKSEIIERPFAWDNYNFNNEISRTLNGLESLSFTYKLTKNWKKEQTDFFEKYNEKRNQILNNRKSYKVEKDKREKKSKEEI